MVDGKYFWMFNGLGADYQMFTTMNLWPPLHENTELLSMLHSYEIRILLHDYNKVAQQVSFIAHKRVKGKIKCSQVYI